MTIQRIVCTCSRYPNQFEGTVDGKEFYFRARHGSWYLLVNEHGTPEESFLDWPVAASGDENSGPDGGTDPADAEKFVRKLLDQYSEGRCPHCEGTGRMKVSAPSQGN